MSVEQARKLPDSELKAKPNFTRRQLDVLSGRAQGLDNIEIAKKLGISSNTVRAHFREIALMIGTGDVHGSIIAMEVSLREGMIDVDGIVNKGIVPLSLREVSILRLIATGKSDEQIRVLLERSLHTVRAQERSINNKLHARSRFHAVAIGLVNGIIDSSF